MPQLTLDPTWNLQDSSKIQEYITCPRSYFFRYVLGWQLAQPNIHLEFGVAIHKAMEVFSLDSQINCTTICKSYNELNYLDAVIEFGSHYRKFFPSDMDLVNSPKNPACAERMLSMSIDNYKHLDRFIKLPTGCVAMRWAHDKKVMRRDSPDRSRLGAALPEVLEPPAELRTA